MHQQGKRNTNKANFSTVGSLSGLNIKQCEIGSYAEESFVHSYAHAPCLLTNLFTSALLKSIMSRACLQKGTASIDI
jgi:hypothetical protein